MLTFREKILWTAGFLEGDGSFFWSDDLRYRAKGRFMVSAAQVQRWPILRLKEYWGGNLALKRRGKTNHQDQLQWQLTGTNARGLMMMLYPFLSPRRQGQIKQTLSHHWGTRGE